MLAFVFALLLGGMSPHPVIRAAAPDAGEMAFWRAVSAHHDPAEYRAYLDAYPNGVFAPLARLRADAGRAAAPKAAPAQIWLRPATPRVKLVDGVTLDVDARGLQNDSNLRLVVVPEGVPDAVADPDILVSASTPIAPARLRLTIPAEIAGEDEVRLYAIAPFTTTYSVVARARVMVEPGVAGATLARDLTREAAELGPAAFEAAHRDRPMLVQAAFLRLMPRTAWRTEWFGGAPVGTVPARVAVIAAGLPGAVVPEGGGQTEGEVACVLVADDPALLRRLSELRPGDPVVMSGVPSTWDAAGPADPVLLGNCTMRTEAN